MNLSELITKLLQVERDLIEQDIEVNTVQVLDKFDGNIDEINVNTELGFTSVYLLNSKLSV